MQWAASGQSQLRGGERGAEVLTTVMAAPQSPRKAAGGSGGWRATTLQPAPLHPLPLRCSTEPSHCPCAGGHWATGNGRCGPIGNGGLLILLPAE